MNGKVQQPWPTKGPQTPQIPPESGFGHQVAIPLRPVEVMAEGEEDLERGGRKQGVPAAALGLIAAVGTVVYTISLRAPPQEERPLEHLPNVQGEVKPQDTTGGL